MKIHQITIHESIQSLNSDFSGLTDSEANRRYQEYRPNRLEKIHKKHPLLQLLKQFISLFAIILWFVVGLAFQEPDKGLITLGFAIIGVIIVNGLFSFWQEYRTKQVVQILRKLLPYQVKINGISAASVIH